MNSEQQHCRKASLSSVTLLGHPRDCPNKPSYFETKCEFGSHVKWFINGWESVWGKHDFTSLVGTRRSHIAKGKGSSNVCLDHSCLMVSSSINKPKIRNEEYGFTKTEANFLR
ncbi:hypothetical protein CARUB_v10007739mg [Capsella rubella]|uniref:Uncharacterized protein n=1 Tax=Capsella rubella TaxID=81985 RepID=R0H6B6_9BRAS|nr:hypothetical protein CARUB_v10007739mg [Capsella rubella]